jgi:hypothetical protein
VVIALADQYAGRHLGFVSPARYRIGHSPLYHQAFHDVTTSTNTYVLLTERRQMVLEVDMAARLARAHRRVISAPHMS